MYLFVIDEAQFIDFSRKYPEKLFEEFLKMVIKNIYCYGQKNVVKD